jgi:2-phosphosulfolactate phosphatase
MTVAILEGLEGARRATGAVVVIDVLRAFTTAAYAFDAGITEIELVSTVEEALARPGFRMGEVGGAKIPGFDHDNSPSRLCGKRLSGRAVQRTGSGTQCAVAATRASELWIASLVVASATARALQGKPEVTLIVSGAPDEGEEDMACAIWIEALLKGETPDYERTQAMVFASRAALKHKPFDKDRPLQDLECATAIDVFDFAMQVERDGSRLVARSRR